MLGRAVCTSKTAPSLQYGWEASYPIESCPAASLFFEVLFFELGFIQGKSPQLYLVLNPMYRAQGLLSSKGLSGSMASIYLNCGKVQFG